MSVLDAAQPASIATKLRASFFGPPGSGKTTLLGTAEKMLVIDVDGGTDSIRNTDAKVIKVKTWDEFKDIVKALVMEKHNYESVSVDTVTMLQELAGIKADLMGHIISDKKDARQAYGDIGAMIRHQLMMLSQGDFHLFFTAHIRDREKAEITKGQYPLVPDLTPAITKMFVAIPSVIGRLYLEQTGPLPTDLEHRVAFGPETISPAKQRDLGLPPVVAGLTIPKLLTLVTQEAK